MFNWHQVSDDPNHGQSSQKWSDFYNGISKLVVLERGKKHHDFLIDLLDVKGKILDIGIAEHTRDYIKNDNWFHRRLRSLEPANEVWGLDINQDLVEFIRKENGWDRLLTHDATLAPVKEGYFDAIHAGDIIEHVNNLGGFMSFCRDSLKPGGFLVITTPNPHAYEFVKRIWRYGTIPANFEHTCWITPPSMNELCRRMGFDFEASYYLCGRKKARNIKLFGQGLYFKFRDFIWYEHIWVLRKPAAPATER